MGGDGRYGLALGARRLETCTRGEDTVARLGGDEFAILLEQALSHQVAVRMAGRILEAMRPAGRELGLNLRALDTVGTIPSSHRHLRQEALMPPRITLVLID